MPCNLSVKLPRICEQSDEPKLGDYALAILGNSLAGSALLMYRSGIKLQFMDVASLVELQLIWMQLALK